jgi:hypothetical protein
MDIRRSPSATRNTRVRRDEDEADPRNASWLANHAQTGTVVLIGGAGLVDFRIRVAQSHLRNDMLPSFWSTIGVSTGQGLLTVPLIPRGDPSLVPPTNAVSDVPFTDFDDPAQYPNVAALQFVDRGDAIVANAERLVHQRNALDLPSMLLQWLEFVWGAGDRRNPLVAGVGVPAAALVETAFGMGGIELTPGLASGSSCPEAIWHSALWWQDYYEKTSTIDREKLATARDTETALPRSIIPRGLYRVRQSAAAVSFEAVKSTTPPAAAPQATTQGKAPAGPTKKKRAKNR